MTFICRLQPNFVDKKHELKGLACGEVVVVPLHATVGDLKRAAEAALRDTYCIAERLIVTDIKELMDVSDEEVLFANKEKCTFGQESIVYLGHIISIQGVAIDPVKVSSVVE